MIQAETIKEIVDNFIVEQGYFLVDLSISSSNNIKVEIDHFDGVSLDFCTELVREIESKLDRDEEDYELEVSSAGLTSAFKTIKQYEKNIGNEVEVITKDGKKFEGVLLSLDENKITLQQEFMKKLEGEKRKKLITENIDIEFKNIKTTKYIIRFK